MRFHYFYVIRSELQYTFVPCCYFTTVASKGWTTVIGPREAYIIHESGVRIELEDIRGMYALLLPRGAVLRTGGPPQSRPPTSSDSSTPNTSSYTPNSTTSSVSTPSPVRSTTSTSKSTPPSSRKSSGGPSERELGLFHQRFGHAAKQSIADLGKATIGHLSGLKESCEAYTAGKLVKSSVRKKYRDDVEQRALRVYADFLGPMQPGWQQISVYLVLVPLECKFPDIYPLKAKDDALECLEDYCL